MSSKWDEKAQRWRPDQQMQFQPKIAPTLVEHRVRSFNMHVSMCLWIWRKLIRGPYPPGWSLSQTYNKQAIPAIPLSCCCATDWVICHTWHETDLIRWSEEWICPAKSEHRTWNNCCIGRCSLKLFRLDGALQGSIWSMQAPEVHLNMQRIDIWIGKSRSAVACSESQGSDFVLEQKQLFLITIYTYSTSKGTTRDILVSCSDRSFWPPYTAPFPPCSFSCNMLQPQHVVM